ncbi:hypothetical protein OG946_13500 [Streptomyces sp. NBC_01808]|uniref:hypothetical protein n=1 Tax=Streptomyces sp. NBC_01808 TaxID=2975947 RepID=UPI002DDBFD7D|nr:hypothetical protein [Streptomyces sp. NBC_01808]WSA38298.1 hypothetical protein OG946_13500 [Streptomyces sp. NBC_01808]
MADALATVDRALPHARKQAAEAARPTNPETAKSRLIETIGRDLVNRLRGHS